VINKHIKYQKVFTRLAVVLLVMFAVQIASTALFYHTHKIDGKSYSHAHPGCEDHAHDAADFAFYQQLQTILFEEAPKLLADLFPLMIQEQLASRSTFIQSTPCQINIGRAPPVLSA